MYLESMQPNVTRVATHTHSLAPAWYGSGLVSKQSIRPRWVAMPCLAPKAYVTASRWRWPVPISLYRCSFGPRVLSLQVYRWDMNPRSAKTTSPAVIHRVFQTLDRQHHFPKNEAHFALATLLGDAALASSRELLIYLLAALSKSATMLSLGEISWGVWKCTIWSPSPSPVSSALVAAAWACVAPTLP